MTRPMTTAGILFLAALVLSCAGRGPSTDDDSTTEESSTSEAGTTENATEQNSRQLSYPDVESLVLRLHADGSVSREGNSVDSLSDAALTQTLKQHRTANGSRPTQGVSGFRAVSTGGRRPQGPETTIVAEADAAYQPLDELLRTCVECGLEKYVLKDASHDRSFSFALFLAVPAEGLPDKDRLPPMRVRLRADSEGQLVRVLFFDQTLGPDLHDLQNRIISLIGDDRGPGSVQETAEMEIDCDANLKVRYLIDALDAVTGYTAADGSRVALLENIRPVSWGSDWQEIEEFEEKLLTPLPDTTQGPPSHVEPAVGDVIEVDLAVPANDTTGR